jgi:hypothetical protein
MKLLGQTKTRKSLRKWTGCGQKFSFTGMIATNSASSASGRNVYKGTSFRSQEPYESVKRFYLEKLVAQGWEFENEKKLNNWGFDQQGRELKWRKGEYKLSIEYAGSANQDWDYSVSISWYRK